MDLYGIIGNPIHHSLSPRIHQLFAEQFNQKITYKPILVPLDGLSSVLGACKQQNFKGLNITLPFKQTIFNLVDHCSDHASKAGAINTIIFQPDGKIFGDNTDGSGLLRDITCNHQYSLHGKKILLLGAGGAVRGVLLPLLQQNPHSIIIANRTASKANELAKNFSQFGNIAAMTYSQLANYKFDLIVNGTSAGLQNIALPLPENILASQAFCYDMAYSKAATQFLAWGKKNGAAKCVDGFGMLLEQAAEAFYLWRKLRPDTQLVMSKLR